MSMKRFLVAVALVMAIFTMGSIAWAYNYKDHVSVAPNGVGDLLFIPLYVSADGWNSRVAIINTSKDRSTVAKVVVRSYFFSQELRDFLVYLSPADMFIGNIRYVDGRAEFYSTDSSVLYDSGINWEDIPEPFATPSNPMKAPLSDVACANDYNGMGYLEIIEAWSAVVNFTEEQKADKQKKGKAIAAAYRDSVAPDTQNILSAFIDIDVEVSGVSYTASTTAIAMKDYDNLEYITTNSPTSIGAFARNSRREIDAALSKNDMAMPYINNDEGVSLHTFTFPTKGSTYYKGADKNCTFINAIGTPLNALSNYFPAGQIISYTPTVYDNDEARAANPFSPPKPYTLPSEFSFVSVSTIIFKQGWINYRLPNPANSFLNDPANSMTKSGEQLDYTGAPVIPLLLDFRAGMSIKNSPYHDGVVSGLINGVVLTLPGYQYSSSYSVS